MIVFYGSRQYGTVWKVGEQKVTTKFLYLQFLPLIPTGSDFIINQDGDDYQGLKLGLNWRSVLLGYFRVWGLIATAILGFAAFAASNQGSYLPILFPVLIGVPWLLSMISWGRLNALELAQCQLLQVVTGLGIFPKRLPRDIAEGIWKSVAEDLVKAEIEVDPEHWRRHQPKPNQPGLPFLYAFALYADCLEPESQWAPLVKTFWEVLENITPEQLVESMQAFADEEEESELTTEDEELQPSMT